MPGYLTFPRPSPADVRDYGALCEAWCHCFREPDHYLPNNGPRALISYSDFTDYMRVSPATITPQVDADFNHDFIYLGTREPWKQAAKNGGLAARCLPRICQELGLRALVVDVTAQVFEESRSIRLTQALPWDAFLARLAHARFLFAPNLFDPSPRVLSEALSLDVPLVVNRQILGGWKYVNTFTGVFFEDEDDVVDAVRQCLDYPRSPRRWFCAHYGPYLAGRRLLQLLRSVDSCIVERSHLAIRTMSDAHMVLGR